MKKNTQFSALLTATLFCSSLAYADDTLSKQTLKTNYQLVYNEKPQAVNNFIDMFKEGMFYGRLRSNTFYYGWEKNNAAQNSHLISGLGGSLVYKSANYADFDFTAGLYYSQAFFNTDDDPVNRLKPGKDVFSRFDYANTGDKFMAVLGQAYINYKGIPKTELKLGRQLVETFYTKSNDTKMIPNTFDGVVVETTALPQTDIKLAYLATQKLRDHTDQHSVLAYGDATATSSLNPQWSENDDSAMHKGLTYSNLAAAGVSTDAPLIVGDIHNKSLKNLAVDVSFYAVPELLSEIMVEANYKIAIDDFSLTPGLRYINQMDNGAGVIGGAAYDGTPVGYKDPTSLDSQMVAARLVGAYSIYKLNLGYSQVFDEADLVTPWRGFPTAGYTRSMARYNWIANTKSYRIELSLNGNKTGVYKDIFIQLSALHTDADENKGQFDENFYYAGFVQNLPFMQDLQWRFRFGYTDTKKTDADSIDSRFEINYLF